VHKSSTNFEEIFPRALAILKSKIGLRSFHNHNYFIIIIIIILYNYIVYGPGSPVGIATDIGLEAPGTKSGGDEIFPSVQTGSGAHPASCTMGTGSFLWVKCGRGVLLTTHLLQVPRSWKSRAIYLSTLWATPGL